MNHNGEGSLERAQKLSAQGRRSRRKGHNFERDVANLLKQIDPDARRNLAETRSGSVDISTDLRLGIQCKSTRKWVPSPTESYQQASEGSLKATKSSEVPLIPVVFHKINLKDPLAILKMEDFLNLVNVLARKAGGYVWRTRKDAWNVDVNDLMFTKEEP